MLSIAWRDLGVANSGEEGEIAKSRVDGEGGLEGRGELIWQGDKTGETMTAMALEDRGVGARVRMEGESIGDES